MVNEGSWDPDSVLLTDDSVPDYWKVCVLEGVFYGENEYNGNLGARISSIFVIFMVSTFCTFFPLLATRFKRLKIPLYGYLFARYFGTGVIIATAFIHLMDPAYDEIGPDTCVGMTGNWSKYSWPPAIMLTALFFIFTVDVISLVVAERKFGVHHSHDDGDIEDTIIARGNGNPGGVGEFGGAGVGGAGGGPANFGNSLEDQKNDSDLLKKTSDAAYVDSESVQDSETEKSFQRQFSGFLVLEFGVLFHSVMIGLNLGASGDEFKTLYIVLVFHQSFEGLGIGARLSAIPFPPEKPKWIPWACCLAYGLVTPLSIAIGLGVRTTYVAGSYNANIVQGVLDSISAGILIYTGTVELLARDFIFNHDIYKDLQKLSFNIVCTLVGAGTMALLGKWA